MVPFNNNNNNKNNQAASKSLGEAPEIVLAPFTLGIWDEDVDMVSLRNHMTGKIRSIWDCGMEAFIAGDWKLAKEKFQEVLEMTNGEDGPSKNLLEVINKHDSTPPPNWQGFRSLY